MRQRGSLRPYSSLFPVFSGVQLFFCFPSLLFHSLNGRNHAFRLTIRGVLQSYACRVFSGTFLFTAWSIAPLNNVSSTIRCLNNLLQRISTEEEFVALRAKLSDQRVATELMVEEWRRKLTPPQAVVQAVVPAAETDEACAAVQSELLPANVTAEATAADTSPATATYHWYSGDQQLTDFFWKE